MLIVPPPKYRGSRRGASLAEVPVPPGLPLVLESASYNHTSLVLLVTFDRAVDISNWDPTQFSLNDPVNRHSMYAGFEGSAVTDTQLEVVLSASGASSGTTVQMSATASTGIVAVDDGGLWAGVSGLVLPYSG